MGIALGLAASAAVLALTPAAELRFCLRTDPKTFDPLLAADEASETVRYLTGGVLIRFNRHTQTMQPELATGWRILDGGRRIDFTLRQQVRFSDGTPFGAGNVAAAIRRLADPALQSPVADTFRAGAGNITARVNADGSVSVLFATPVSGVELLFDQLAISHDGKAVLGPFLLSEYKSGHYVQLRRNPHYWKTDASGRRLPYLDSVRLDIQSNREIEMLRFRRGEIDVVDKMDPEAFDRLRRERPAEAVNAGVSLDSEFLWFNQKPQAPIPAHRKNWFRSAAFRRALSAAINRADLVRLAYLGYAHAAAGPVSPGNRMWVNSAVKAVRYDPAAALELLRGEGFRREGAVLRDRDNHPVTFSLLTNAGSKTRSRMSALVQQDLKKIGIDVRFTPMEFQSLVERITRTHDYEAVLLGFTNIEVDPNAQMNIWLSSSSHHAWNPAQASPATEWEAEVDRLLRLQQASTLQVERKRAFDRVQEIIAEQAPILYLVHPDVLAGVSRAMRGVQPSALPPHLFWNIEHLSVEEGAGRAPR